MNHKALAAAFNLLVQTPRSRVTTHEREPDRGRGGTPGRRVTFSNTRKKNGARHHKAYRRKQDSLIKSDIARRKS
jgi:hypothetical protein